MNSYCFIFTMPLEVGVVGSLERSAPDRANLFGRGIGGASRDTHHKYLWFELDFVVHAAGPCSTNAFAALSMWVTESMEQLSQ